jgi:DNA-binding NtrC family response regulator
MLLVDSGTPDIKEGLFIKKIKKMHPKLSIAIIMGNETGDKLNQIKNSSVDLVITKPVEINRLMNQVSEILATKI